jgi:hypothetical protein
VTAAKECFLGVSLAMDAGAAALTQAYGVFRTEAQALVPDYSPETVNTDGWVATQTAWQTLFPNITLILCFLHTVLAVQQRCRREPTLFKLVTDKLWHLFHSDTVSQFSQRLRRIHEWAQTQVTHEPVRQKLLALKDKAMGFRPRFTFPDAYRTSNQVDRLMNIQDRLLYQMQYLHGTQKSVNLALRAMAILWNFHPYCQKIQRDCLSTRSPFRDLNGFSYHNHWLRNLLIASSLNGRGLGRFLEHKLI